MMIDDTISRQAAIAACLKGKTEGLPATNVACDCCAERIRVLPPAERKKGRWISLDDFRGKYNDRGYKCSECDEHSDYEENFCPNCGADMREVDDERPN